MAKLGLLLASLALFLLVANASVHTTVVIDEENPRGESCQQQCQQQEQLQQCQMFMRQQSQQGGGSWDNQQGMLRDCCRELQQLDNRCRCQCLEQAVRSQQQQGQQYGQEMFETASEIPRMCQIQPMQGCDFRMPYISA